MTALSLATLAETKHCGIYQSISTGPKLDDQLRISSSPVNLANEVNLQRTKSDCCNLCRSLEPGPSRARYFPRDMLLLTTTAWERLSRAVGVNSNMSRGKYLAREGPGSRLPLSVPDQPWHNISMDFIIGLPLTLRKNDAVFIFVDRLTKCIHLIPTTSTINAEGTAELYVKHVFSAHGLSKSIVCDRAPRFTASFFKVVFDRLGVKLQMSTANHPQTDSLTERVNRVVKDCLRLFVNHRQSNWDEVLSLCQFAINNSYQSSTSESPFCLNSGYHPLTPSSFVDDFKFPTLFVLLYFIAWSGSF